MKKAWASAAAIVVCLGAPAFAHRLDEYLQATIISVENGHMQAAIRLIPGVAVSPIVIASIDTDGDGILSADEQRDYALRVLRDLSIRVDGHGLNPRLLSFKFPETGEMKEGLGEIQIEFSVDLPRSNERNRTIVFENHHQSRISAYLVNCLVPRDKDIRITAQNRNENQSFYELNYVQGGGDSDGLSLRSWWSSMRGSLTGKVGFASLFRLGIRHIAEGTDHLLFLLVMLFPAPLLVVRRRWAGYASAGSSLRQILKIVTAFTVGHSITLALAALGVVHVPSRSVEVLIAVSILVSAVHALRPLFPGREAGIAAFFGLVHGLAFATTLGQLGLGGWERTGSILAFNLGIETMQLVVVAATMPSLVLLSRTRAYSPVRMGGALFAAFASTGWIAERLFEVHIPVDPVVNSIAQRAGWIAAILFLVSVVCWLTRTRAQPLCRESVALGAEEEFVATGL